MKPVYSFRLPGNKRVVVSTMRSFGKEYIRFQTVGISSPPLTVPLEKAHELIIGVNRGILALANSRKAVQREAEKAS